MITTECTVCGRRTTSKGKARRYCSTPCSRAGRALQQYLDHMDRLTGWAKDPTAKVKPVPSAVIDRTRSRVRTNARKMYESVHPDRTPPWDR